MRVLFPVSILLSLAWTFNAGDPSDYPKGYFEAPVRTEIRLSGTFGELRPNHFHSGIDIKGQVGQSLYAAAGGYVSRVKVEAGGYGKALYIRHPNGYTTVYAHMDKFDPAIEAYAKRSQYQQQSFEIDLYPQQGQFAFNKGEKIGTMGLTGGTSGPHLHFEIRNSATSTPINPLLFGLDVRDSKAPDMRQLKVYTLNKKLETINSETYELVQNGNNSYNLSSDTLLIGAWRVGFGLKTYDQQDAADNMNGIYALAMYLDDELVYDFEMESFAFDETRYLNAHLDYQDQISRKGYYNRTYKLPGNLLSIYQTKENDGIIALSKSQANKVRMVARDAWGNTASLQFWVRRTEVSPPEDPPVYDYVLPYDEANAIDNYSLYLNFPKGCFYENLYLQYQSIADATGVSYSNVHHIHNFTVPVHRYFNIAIRPTAKIPDHLRQKAFVAHRDSEDRVTNMGGAWKDGRLHARARTLGDFSIMIDDVPPGIQAVIFRSNLRGYNLMSFKIQDNFATGGSAKDLRYKGTIDGKWILMVYDAKNDLLTHRFEPELAEGKHSFRLEVTDALGNRSVFEQTFLY